MLDARSETLADLAEEWFPRYARPNLARNTLESYAGVWDNHSFHDGATASFVVSRRSGSSYSAPTSKQRV